jgi:hypothetical protein
VKTEFSRTQSNCASRKERTNDFEAAVGAFGGQELRQRPCFPTKAAAYVEDMIVGSSFARELGIGLASGPVSASSTPIKLGRVVDLLIQENIERCGNTEQRTKRKG